MANYVTNTSDKSKKTALLFWAIGCLGLLGFEDFYVLKFKRGLLHVVLGTAVILSICAMATSQAGDPAVIPMSVIFWGICAIPNLARLLSGTFKDNTGQYLRH